MCTSSMLPLLAASAADHFRTTFNQFRITLAAIRLPLPVAVAAVANVVAGVTCAAISLRSDGLSRTCQATEGRDREGRLTESRTICNASVGSPSSAGDNVVFVAALLCITCAYHTRQHTHSHTHAHPHTHSSRHRKKGSPSI